MSKHRLRPPTTQCDAESDDGGPERALARLAPRALSSRAPPPSSSTASPVKRLKHRSDRPDQGERAGHDPDRDRITGVVAQDQQHRSDDGAD